jgi:vacuolar protein sorting-associated protein 41
MKRALYLIIDRLGDVSRAIAFAKEQDDPDLWEDLLKYSMDKPRFIRGLLEEVGTAINPITLVRRIPEGLEIEGLREGLKHIMKEHEIQYSISSGVARVLRSEVAAAQNLLRIGQRKGIKFEVVIQAPDHVDIEAKGAFEGTNEASKNTSGAVHNVIEASEASTKAPPSRKWRQGHCAECLEPFVAWESETLVGFACSHVFHVRHLLERLHPGEAVDEDVVGAVASQRTHHLVGTKVTHARLLKDKIRGGCPVCTNRDVSM